MAIAVKRPMTKPSQAAFWDERYAADEYLFGTAPNAFLARELHRLTPGSKVLAVADGEGRNSVFLAQQGHRVFATDVSERALDKARALAERRRVEVEYRQANLAEWKWPEEAFDAVVGIFIQFSGPELREDIFEGIHRSLKPRGLLLLEGYREEQLAYGTGGPPNIENLYTQDGLRRSFSTWEIELLDSYDAEIEEGPGHSGKSALIDLIARKPL